MSNITFSNESVITLIRNTGDNLIFKANGGFIFEGGWLWSWTTNLLIGLVIGLIIWNIYLTWKITALTGSESRGKK